MEKNNIKTKPSILVKELISTPSISVSFTKKATARIARSDRGISFDTVLFLTARGKIIAETPRIKRVLEIFDPIILPRAIPVDSFQAAIELTISSGADVPKATIVKPMTKFDRPNFLAIEDDPSTKISAPLTKKTNPKMNNIIVIYII